jgi:TolB-like protein/Flp pilus assembly protein TadD
MKRCPQCNRVESDNTLSFCRVDGATLLRDSGSVSDEAGTIKFDSGSVSEATIRFDSDALASELHTSILPQAITERTLDRATAPTEVLPSSAALPTPAPTAENAGVVRKPRWWLAIVAVLGVALIAALISYFTWFRERDLRTSDLPPIQSIAVMPFINASGNADAEYLSDGMTETLINGLAQLPNLSVKARSSVFRYKGKEVDPQTAGNELGVQAILNGRVVQRGDDLTLYLSLVDTRTGNQIWGDHYNRKQADLLSLQSEIGRDVSSKLRRKLSGADEEKLAKNYTQNAEAYQLYLQGRFFWNKRTPQSIQKSIEYFQQAIEKDPNYALGYAGLSDGYALLAYYGGGPASELFPKAKDAALKAVSLDPNLAEPHNALGFVSVLSDYDYAGAEREYRRAIEINPNYALSHQNLGVMLNRIGRQSEGMAEIQRALELEPFSTIVNRLYGDVLTYNRRYDDALNQFKKTLELEPSFPTTHLGISALYQMTGKYAESVESFASYLQLSGRPQAAAQARASFAAGGWQGYLSEMTGPRRPEGLSPYVAATYFVRLGEKDKAFVELDKALEDRDWRLLYIKVDPRLDPLRDDPRYQDLIRIHRLCRLHRLRAKSVNLNHKLPIFNFTCFALSLRNLWMN